MLKTILAAGLAVAFTAALAAAQTGPVTVVMKTSKGDITVALDPGKAPATVKNFLDYVDAKFFDGTIFHRVIPGFMIQGGGLTADFAEKAGRPPIRNEAGNGLKNLRGTIAMARTNDPHSASSQFFINLVDNAFLDYKSATVQGFGYCVFGKVVAGQDVVDAIAAVPTATVKGYADAPRQTVTILSIRRAEAK